MEREFQKENGQTDHHQIYELDTIKHKRMKSVEKKHTEDKVEVRCAHRSRCDSRQFSPLWTFLAFLQNDPVFFCLFFFFTCAAWKHDQQTPERTYRWGDYSDTSFFYYYYYKLTIILLQWIFF